MNKYRVDKEWLWLVLEGWSNYLPRKIHLVACGGTALTLQDIKPSTKDVDFLVPIKEEYDSLIYTIRKLGYENTTGFGWSRGDSLVFDLFPGSRVYITELLESPLKRGNHTLIKKFKKITVCLLNDYDLIITKMFRGSVVDIEDCLSLIRNRGKNINIQKLVSRYKETAQYDVNPERMNQNLDALLRHLPKSFLK
ncbi:MAG: hypothetical protein HYT97_06780 [Elusimicrobia bacterium]|nr:hypothetical protein [Elusimicrobiota bacterium]